MAIRIEIDLIEHREDEKCWVIRIGDLTGCSECSFISKEEVLEEVSDAMGEITAKTGVKNG